MTVSYAAELSDNAKAVISEKNAKEIGDIKWMKLSEFNMKCEHKEVKAALREVHCHLLEVNSILYNGTCKRWNDDKGFGFLTVNDGTGDVFVHRTEIKSYLKGNQSLKVGECVEFQIVIQDDGRKKAVDLTGKQMHYQTYCILFEYFEISLGLNGSPVQGQRGKYNEDSAMQKTDHTEIW